MAFAHNREAEVTPSMAELIFMKKMIINSEKIQIIYLLKLSLNFFIRMKNKTSIDKNKILIIESLQLLVLY